ncbi:hypothetical protein NP233_g11951 [Leucocoprinus birnbaumii]|uniref:Uncharacterized protein n=1 Tax=Leucocoprinus birnbaumii TaxID=56174 RepID=A0AAD5YNH1_9AGAR|nr:hypothetical protein NP233_g11951 [Leucocoprinus birnbaumii]
MPEPFFIQKYRVGTEFHDTLVKKSGQASMTIIVIGAVEAESEALNDVPVFCQVAFQTLKFSSDARVEQSQFKEEFQLLQLHLL